MSEIDWYFDINFNERNSCHFYQIFERLQEIKKKMNYIFKREREREIAVNSVWCFHMVSLYTSGRESVFIFTIFGWWCGNEFDCSRRCWQRLAISSQFDPKAWTYCVLVGSHPWLAIYWPLDCPGNGQASEVKAHTTCVRVLSSWLNWNDLTTRWPSDILKNKSNILQSS